jgi:hypothetical protein
MVLEIRRKREKNEIKRKKIPTIKNQKQENGGILVQFVGTGII